MATTNINDEQARELLPWYLNGTLEDDEAARVSAQMEDSDEFRAEARETDIVLRALGEDVAVPMLTHERLQSVMARLDDEPRVRRPATNSVARFSAWLRKVSSPLATLQPLPAALAAAVALVAVAIVLKPNPGPGDPGANDYQTLYDERPAVPIEVTLMEGVSGEEVQTLFNELSVSATQQPDGTYRIELPPNTSVSELYGVLQELRADERVAGAEALTGED